MSIFKRPGSPYYYTEFVFRERRIVRSTRCTSARDAEAFERKLRDEIARETPKTAPTPSFTLDQACGKYWKQWGRKLRWASEVSRHLRLICRHLDKEMPLVQLSNKDVNRLVEGRQKDGAGPAGVNRTLAVLQGVHTRAGSNWEEPVRAIAWREHKLKEPKGRTRDLTPEEAKRLIAALHPATAFIVRFLVLTGLRLNEALQLTWAHVQFDRRLLINVQVKGGHKRNIPIGDDALMVLHEVPREGRYVFDATNFRKRWKAGLKAAGIADFKVHDLRHTLATWLRQQGVALEVVRDVLGHSSIAVTQKYAHVHQGEVREALQKVPSLGPISENIVQLKRGNAGE